jgi:menaquinone-dependent protoporphyrinogen oxidase
VVVSSSGQTSVRRFGVVKVYTKVRATLVRPNIVSTITGVTPSRNAPKSPWPAVGSVAITGPASGIDGETGGNCVSVLVLYASKHGATRGIAERIAATLEACGQQAEARPASDAGDLAGCDGFVIGSAVHVGCWLKDAVAFVERNSDLLARRPVWLFSSGPLGPETTDPKGQDLTATCEPKEIKEFAETIHPRGHRVFSGALDPGGLSPGERALRRLPAARAVMPEGDFRDWTAIEEWARAIAEQMTQLETAHNTGRLWQPRQE